MLDLLQTALALVLLYAGGELLVRGAAALALRTGLTPLAVGLTVVAFGTSAPELVVSLTAALSGSTDIAVGNVVGSNIANVGLILGVCALLRPVTVRLAIIRRDAPIVIAVSLALFGVLADRVVGRLEGGLLLAALVGFLVITVRQARRETAETAATTGLPAGSESTVASVLRIVAGVGLLLLGGNLLVGAAVRIATALGVTEAVIGLTIVAIGTSLPELATSVIAALRREGDIALGNVLGSNVFNVLGILGGTAIVRPLPLGGVSWIDLGSMLAFAVVLTAMLYTRSLLERFEGAGLLLLYAAYVWLLIAAV